MNSDQNRFLILVVFSLLLQPAVMADSAGAVNPDPWVSGYYVAYQHDMLPPEQIDWSGLTHIVMGRITANADGTVNTDFDIGSPAGPALARQVAQLAHANNKKAILMLGGDGNGAAIHSAVRDHRPEFIANLVRTMDDYGYDGIDLDWENDVDWVLFASFAKELRDAAPDKIITLPGGAINANYQVVDPQVVNVTQYVDQFNLMTYYPSTAWSGVGWNSWHNSPLKGMKPTTPVSIEDSLARYAAAGVPKNKLGMGVGFYAIGYAGGITGPDQPTTDGIIRGGDNEYPLSKLFGSGGAYDEKYRRWDQTASEPYLSLPAGDSFGCRYVSFEDEQSLIEKGTFTRENGYGGTIIWTINEGYVKSHSSPNFLMQALRKGFIDPDAPAYVAISTDPAVIQAVAGETVGFKALVTGTMDKTVTWAASESDGGTITQDGVYTAPAAAPGGKKTFHITATSHTDPAKTATSTITVGSAQDMAWDPGLHRHTCAEWWMEVFADDLNTTSLELEHNGIRTTMQSWGTYGGKPQFSANVQVKSGDTIRFHAVSKDGRKASTSPIAYTYTTGSEILDCPVPAVVPAILPLPGQAAAPTDPDHDGVYEDVNGNGRADFADLTLYFLQMDWIEINEPVAAFDPNSNGRIDFADISSLFEEL